MEQETSKMSREQLQEVLYSAPEEVVEEVTEEVEETEEQEESEETVEETNEVVEEPEEETPDDNKNTLEAENKELREKYERLLKKAENQDKFFDRVGTEVGLLRKRTPEQEREELEKIRDAYIEDPVEGHRLMQEYQDKQNKAKDLEKEYEANQMIERNRESISKLLPEFKEDSIEELSKLMAEDGAPEEALRAFKAQPYLMDQATLYNLYKRNDLTREVTTLKEQLEAKEKEIEALKKKPDELLDNIEKASKVKTLTNSASGNKNTQAPDEKSVHRMSREELKKLAAGG